jgi:hypothetical protein
MNLEQPLDLASQEDQEFLKGIQGSILEGHRGDEVALLFLQFNTESIGDDNVRKNGSERRVEVAKRISKFAKTFVNTAAHERGAEIFENDSIHRHAQLKTKANQPNADLLGKRTQIGVFFTILLTYEGYRKLGLERIAPSDRYFRGGIRAKNEWVSSREDVSKKWDEPYRDKDKKRDLPIHAMVLIAVRPTLNEKGMSQTNPQDLADDLVWATDEVTNHFDPNNDQFGKLVTVRKEEAVGKRLWHN